MRQLSLLLLVIFFISCEEQSAEAIKTIRPVKYSTVEQSLGIETHTFSGVAKAQNETKLSFKVSGTLNSVMVDLGDRVHKDQLIATIDPADYKIKTNQAQSQKDGSIANVQSAEANAKSAETQVINSQASYDRAAKLYENNSVSLSEYQKAKSALDAAKTQYEAANSQIKAANNQVSSADQQVQSAANQVSYTRLLAPMNAVVTDVLVESNEAVNSGKVIAVVSSLGRPEIEIGVPESLINNIQKGQNVKVTFSTSPGATFEGKVDQVAYASGTSPTYPVIVELDKTAEQIRPGMAANVEFIFSKNSDLNESRLIVPMEAVGKDKDSNFVFVLTKKSEDVYVAEKKLITIGTLLPAGFELINGLQGGEVVATAGLKSLMNGTEVKLLKD